MDDADLEAAENVIAATTSEIFERVFFLGPYARRVSFSSMQNRALNLVWALQRKDVIEPGQHVAVIGGGLSGVTATAALLELGYTVTMYEDGENVMHRQSTAAHRYVHPTVNRWPEQPVRETTAVPYFDWVSAVCSEIVATVRGEWKDVLDDDRFTFVEHATVEAFSEADQEVGVQTSAFCATRGERYKAVLVTSGFAEEKYKDRRLFPGYWRPDGLEADLEAPENKDEKYLISGCGDGGLIDALRIIHSNFRKGELIVDVARMLFETSWAGLKSIADAEAALTRNEGALKDAVENGSNDLKRVYWEEAGRMPGDIAEVLDASLRRNRGVRLVTLLSMERNPFSPMSAPIHKLLVAHGMRAHMIQHRCCVVVDPHIDHVMVAPCGTKLADATAAPQTELKGRVILRHGAQPNFRKFFADDDKAEQLISKQKLLSGNLDRRFWAQGPRRLKTWPPERDYDKDLKKRHMAAANLVRRLIGKPNGDMVVTADGGFMFLYPDDYEADVQAANLPPDIFGFGLKAVARSQMRMSAAEAAGSETPVRRQPQAAQPVGPGMPIVSALNGRLGPICVDPLGRVVALTAVHLAPAGHVSGVPVNDPDRRAVGTFIEGANDTGEDIALIAINDDVDVSPSYGPDAKLAGIIDPLEAFGDPVYLERTGGGRALGYIRATQAGATFRQPGSNKVFELRDLVQVRSADPSSRFAVTGDSGAPVVSGDGRLLGIVVCNDVEDKSVSYVLPCGRAMARHGLRLLDEPRPRRVEPTVDPSELDVIAGIIDLYAAANRRDQRVQPLDLGPPPLEDEVADESRALETQG